MSTFVFTGKSETTFIDHDALRKLVGEPAYEMVTPNGDRYPIDIDLEKGAIILLSTTPLAD